jgi:protein-tyrosine phosphatase
VLFVCLGNICRSPMAHGLLDHLVEERGLAGRFVIDSAGTAAYHAGEAPDPRTLDVLARHGIGLSHRARRVRDDDFERFDWLLAMDRANRRDLLARCPEGLEGKVQLTLAPIGGGDVADPYYGGPDGFDHNFRQLRTALDAWLDRW